MSGKDQKAPLKRLFLNPRTATIEDAAEFFRSWTGREPDPEGLKKLMMTLEKIRQIANAKKSLH